MTAEQQLRAAREHAEMISRMYGTALALAESIAAVGKMLDTKRKACGALWQANHGMTDVLRSLEAEVSRGIDEAVAIAEVVQPFNDKPDAEGNIDPGCGELGGPLTADD